MIVAMDSTILLAVYWLTMSSSFSEMQVSFNKWKHLKKKATKFVISSR